MTRRRPHEDWARTLLESLGLPQPAGHAERTIAPGGLRIDELVDLRFAEPPEELAPLGPLGAELCGHLVAFEFYSRRLTAQEIKRALGKLCVLATSAGMTSRDRVAMVCLGVDFPNLVEPVLAPCFERALWSDGAWRFRTLFEALQFWVLDVERLPPDEEGTSVWRLFTHVNRLDAERVLKVRTDPAIPEEKAKQLEDIIMQRAEEQGLEETVWRGAEYHRQEGLQEGLREGLQLGRQEGLQMARKEILALAEAVLPAREVEGLRGIDDLRRLRQAVVAALERARRS